MHINMKLLPILLLVNWVSARNSQELLLSTSSSPLIELHKALVEIESITFNEQAVTKWLVSYLTAQNFTVEMQEVTAATKAGADDARYNVFAYPGKQRRTRTLISSHLDTVPPFWKYERKGDEIWGRGTVDAKGSVAAQITAVQQLVTAGEIGEGDVAMLFVLGEETGGDGMLKANELGLSWETVIFGEPTELRLASGHKGIVGMDIRAKGKAGHSGYPELGRSANAMLIPALAALLKVQLPWSEKYGNSTLNVGRVEGGVAANVIAEDASAKIAIRIAGGTSEAAEKILLDAIASAGEELDVDVHPGYGPVPLDTDVEGFETIVVNYGTDIPNLKGDHKRYLYGPGSILVAHSDHEHLTVADLETAVKGYKTLIEHSLK